MAFKLHVKNEQYNIFIESDRMKEDSQVIVISKALDALNGIVRTEVESAPFPKLLPEKGFTMEGFKDAVGIVDEVPFHKEDLDEREVSEEKQPEPAISTKEEREDLQPRKVEGSLLVTSRQIEKIGSERSTFPLADLLSNVGTAIYDAQKISKANLWQPPAAPQKDESEYPVLADCPKCEEIGQELKSPVYHRFVKCSKCNQKLFMRQAKEERGEVDDMGYAFYASDVFKTREEIWNERNGKETE